MDTSNTMAPWDELTYFDVPIETFFSAPAIGSTLAKGNPMRVYLSFCATAIAGAMTVSLSPKAASGQGYVINTAQPILILTARDHPMLVQAAWFMVAGGQNLTVTEVTMHDWPRGICHEQQMQPVNGGTLRANRSSANVRPLSVGTRSTLRRLWDAFPGLR